MLTSSVQSAPCATPEAANEALSGLLLQVGKNQDIKVIHTDVYEVDGLWIATAFFEIESLEAEETEEEERSVESGKEAGPDLDTNEETLQIAMWHGAIPGQVNEASPAQDIPEPQDPVVEYDYEGINALAQVYEEPEQASPYGQIYIAQDYYQQQEQTEALQRQAAEELQREFQQAEEAEQPAYREEIYRDFREETYEDREAEAALIAEREELEEEREKLREEEELERMRREASPLQVEPPVEPPTPSA